ncbi:MAG TPA: hypothetical protein VHL53_11810 [Acidimicrobiia bacterium]|nr:hypothetical protein [Acidimicrobiia bacterium]
MVSLDLAAAPGWKFPGGEFTIDAAENERLCRLVGADPSSDGSAHPLYAFIAAQRGMGVTVGEFLLLLGTPPEDGPMLASCRLEYAAPLLVDRPYRVQGGIIDLVRKEGARMGPFDLVTFELEVLDGADVVTRCRNAFVLPRGRR